MPKVTEEHLETRKRQILGAAMACFAGQGFHQTTIQDICTEAGLSPGAVYRYFTSKEEIIEACCVDCQEIDPAMFERMAETEDTLQVLETIAEAAFGQLDLPEAQVILPMNVNLWAEAIRSPQLKALSLALSDLWVGVLGGVLERAQNKGEIDRAIDTQSAARVLLSMWQGLVVQKALQPSIDVATYSDAAVAMFSGTFWRGADRSDLT